MRQLQEENCGMRGIFLRIIARMELEDGKGEQYV
jgi:hypothetical protein